MVLSQDQTWGGPEVDEAAGVSVAPDGSVYVTSNAFEIGVDMNIILVKFDTSGNLMWEKIGGPGGVGIGCSIDTGQSGEDDWLHVRLFAFNGGR